VKEEKSRRDECEKDVRKKKTRPFRGTLGLSGKLTHVKGRQKEREGTRRPRPGSGRTGEKAGALSRGRDPTPGPMFAWFERRKTVQGSA